MLGKFGIGPRLLLLLAVQAVVLIAVGATAIVGLNVASRSTELLNKNVSENTQLSYIADTLRADLQGTVHGVNTGTIGWDEGRDRIRLARRQFDEDWSAFTRGVTLDDAEFIADTLEPGLERVRDAFGDLDQLFESQDAARLKAFVVEDMESMVDPLLNALLASSAQRQLTSETTFRDSLAENQRFLMINTAAIIIGLLLAAGLGFFIFRSITRPIDRISNTVHEVSEGNYAVRSDLAGSDEIARLGGALDSLLEDRVQTLARSEAESEQLNESVMQVLEAVAQLSERDLTVTVPVTADIAGPVADSINQLAEETSDVLKQVNKIARAVALSATQVNRKSASLNQTAKGQLVEVNQAAKELSNASITLGSIAETANSCRDMAANTTESTTRAMNTVHETIEGMHEIRDGIQETGKRLKRLGERSQEIDGIVEIIGSIAERTHVLALNASMQAAAAGEAGRRFAVVADEVQRLAENARDATRQIGGLIKSIQIDTNDTVTTMDKTINQVVEGSRRAEAAGQRMEESTRRTSELVEAVQSIATGSDQQARISRDLQNRASGIVDSTTSTARELVQQVSQTRKLVQYSQMLIRSVQVFKLPA